MKIKYNKIVNVFVGIIIVITTLFTFLYAKKSIQINREFLETIKELDKEKTNDNSIDITSEVEELIDARKYSESYTLVGIKEFKNGNIDISKKNLEYGLEKLKYGTNYLSKFYAYKYLFKIYKLEGNYEKAKLCFGDAINSIPKRYYNETYEEIGELIKNTFDVELLRETATDTVNNILKNKLYVAPEIELYLRERTRSLYILCNKYAEVTNSLIDSIHLAKEINNNYSLADSEISLGIVLMELGGVESAERLFIEALNIEIEDSYKNAQIKTYGYLNLANLVFYHLRDADRAIDILSNIEQYRYEFTEEDFRDIEIYKLIYEADSYTLEGNLDIAKEKLHEAEELLREDKFEYYINKNLEFYLSYARYFYAKGNYDYALDSYKYILTETRILEYKEMERIVLSEIIKLTNYTGKYEECYKYTNELISLNNEREELRYYDYTVYISKSIKEEAQLRYRYNQYIISTLILYSTIVLIFLFYIYSNKKIKKLKYLSEYDGLTNVYNRKKFDMDYEKLLKENNSFACIIMDIDNFKTINDTYGHSFGDVVLKNTSKKIMNLLSENNNIYRYGGEEFVVLSKYQDKSEAINLAEEIRKSIEEMIWREKIVVTVSIGVAFSDIEKERVLEASDENLYKAKKSGKNRVIY